jgi:gentisate 1,2-dioxygenase
MTVPKPEQQSDLMRSQYYRRISDRHLTPLWDALLFSFSDRPVQQALGLWREHRQ